MPENDPTQKKWRKRVHHGRVVMMAAMLALVAQLLRKSQYLDLLRQPERHFGNKLVSYQCPAHNKSVVDDANNKLRISSFENQISQLFRNETEFFSTFRKQDFDLWGVTYENFKKGSYDWKSRMYDVKDGESIYESASGIGLNLYATMEILHEAKGINSLVLYGNDYLKVSAKKSNALFDKAPPFGAVKGQLCHGDSKNLTRSPRTTMTKF